MASGHMNRVKRPDTWLHRPMLQNVKKVLANPEPSTQHCSHSNSHVLVASPPPSLRRRDLHQKIHAARTRAVRARSQ